jgi:hypothetical protein
MEKQHKATITTSSSIFERIRMQILEAYERNMQNTLKILFPFRSSDGFR